MQFSKDVFKLKLPKGYEMQVYVNTQAEVKTSLSFPFALLFNIKGLGYANRLCDAISGIGKKEKKPQ
jgi:hypothetical protein